MNTFVNTFGSQVLSFYKQLPQAPQTPSEVTVLYPHRNPKAWDTMEIFYQKYYDDHNPRTFLIGINPGRLGAGTTGIPFTDPIRLKNVCGIDNDFEQKPELSSKFIYHIIDVFGGAERFYNTYYFTSVSPLGFTRSGKNLNYYDLKELQEAWEPFMVACLKKQIAFGANRRAFSLGQGKNIKYLQYLNQKYKLFDEIIPLPHPRWIMQYRLKKLDQFVEEYRSKLAMVAGNAD